MQPPPTAAEWLTRIDALSPAPAAFRTRRLELVALLGTVAVDAFLAETFAELRKLDVDAEQQKAKTFWKQATTQWVDHAEGVLHHELKRIEGRKVLRLELLRGAVAGTLSVAVGRRRPESDYYQVDAAVAAADVELDKAAQWIVALSNNKARDVAAARTTLRNFPLPGPARPLPAPNIEDGHGITAATFGDLPYLDQLIVQMGGDAGIRMHHLVNLDARYPSTWGGRYVIQAMFGDSPMPPQQLASLDYWTNWAMYFAYTVGAAQAFRDGNKRVAHAYYAAIVLFGTGRFVAPTMDFENRLLAMN